MGALMCMTKVVKDDKTIVTDELVQKVDQCVGGKRCFMISELSGRISTNFEDYFVSNCHGQIELP
jgi:hypothetical protein